MMDSKTSERVLKTMIDIKQDIFLNNPLPDLSKALPDLSEDVILAAISHLKDLELINPQYGDDTVLCIAINPSAVGYLREKQEARENKEQESRMSIQNTFNIQKNYGAVGTNSDFTINNTFDLTELDKLIRGHVPEDSMEYKELKELQAELQAIIDLNKPISKGYLSKFSDLMQRHSWLTGALTGFLLKWVTTVQ